MKRIFNTLSGNYDLWANILKIFLAVATPFLLISWFSLESAVLMKYLFVLVLVVASLLFLCNPGRLELDNGVLTRRNFIKLWSINVSSITDIIQGCSLGLVSFSSFFAHTGQQYSIRGLSFRTSEGKFYEFSADIQDNLIQSGDDPISLLKEINPLIQFHFDSKPFRDKYGLGWAGDKRLTKRRVTVIFAVILLLVVLLVMHNYFHLI